MDDTIISVTTIPRRLNTSLLDVIKSIKQQTFKCKLLINIPESYVKWKDPINIPEELIDDNIIVFRTIKDYGPKTKLLGAIEYINRNNITHIRKIITIDDDIIYSDINHIQKLTDISNKYPDRIITYSGIKLGHFPYRYQNGLLYNNTGLVDAPAGYYGVVYPVDCIERAKLFFEDDFVNTLPSGIFNDDDAYFGIVFGAAKIPMYSCLGDTARRRCGGSSE